MTQDQRDTLRQRIPSNYPLGEYVEDMNSLQDQIDGMIHQGFGYLTEKEYGVAGTTFTDADDLRDIYAVLLDGGFHQAQRDVDRLDTAVRDHIPVRLYDRLYGE